MSTYLFDFDGTLVGSMPNFVAAMTDYYINGWDWIGKKGRFQVKSGLAHAWWVIESSAKKLAFMFEK